MQPAQRIDLGQHVVAVGRVFAVIVQQQLAGLGGYHAVAMALQQGQAQFLFEQADLAADGRGHDAQFFGGGTNGAAVDGFKQIAGAGVLKGGHAAIVVAKLHLYSYVCSLF